MKVPTKVTKLIVWTNLNPLKTNDSIDETFKQLMVYSNEKTAKTK